MFPKRNASNASSASAGGRSNQRGLFENSAWMCDCDPRLPAEHFQVKKQTPNFGRWFYTCQKAQSERCGFFLWDEDAQPRMKAAVISNSRSEPAPQNAPGDTSPSKRKLPWNNEGNRSPETEALEAAADAAERNYNRINAAMRPPETPRKAIKFEDVDSPQLGLPTPGTSPRSKEAGNPSAMSEQQTPTPRRFRDALVADSPSKEGSSTSLIEETMELLQRRGVKLSADTEAELSELLGRHEKQRHGLVKGRDIARAAVAAREGTIAQQEKQLTSLGTQLESYVPFSTSARSSTASSSVAGPSDRSLSTAATSPATLTSIDPAIKSRYDAQQWLAAEAEADRLSKTLSGLQAALDQVALSRLQRRRRPASNRSKTHRRPLDLELARRAIIPSLDASAFPHSQPPSEGSVSGDSADLRVFVNDNEEDDEVRSSSPTEVISVTSPTYDSAMDYTSDSPQIRHHRHQSPRSAVSAHSRSESRLSAASSMDERERSAWMSSFGMVLSRLQMLDVDDVRERDDD